MAFSQVSPPTLVPVAPESLANSFVRCFYKDSKGYMWLGTSDGLIRYDGTRTYRYEHNPEDTSSLCHNNINVIIEDTQQNLWVGTARGLCVYDREKDHFTNVDVIAANKNHLNNSYITALSFDQDGQLWIGTHGGGVNVYDPHDLAFSYLGESANSNMANDYIISFLCIDDLMYCGTKGGLKIFNTTDQVSIPLTFIGDSLPTRQITQLISDKVGNIWLSTQSGEIMLLIPHNGYYTFKTIVPADTDTEKSLHNILTISKDRQGNLWIGGENAGLSHLDTKTAKVTRFLADSNHPKRLPTNSIRSIYMDDTGLTWIGTFNRGAYLIDDHADKFDAYGWGEYEESDLEGKNVRSFAEDRHGNIWIAVDGIGLIRLDAKTHALTSSREINSKLNHQYITALVCDRYGNLWVGTAGRGAYKIDLQTYAFENYSLHSGGFGDDKVSCLYEDKKGGIWAGTTGSGLFYFDDTAARFNSLSQEDQTNAITKTAYVSSLTEDADGSLWVGTMYGLFALKKKAGQLYEYRRYDHAGGSLSSSSVQVVYEDRKKNLWVGTTDNGLNVKYRQDTVFKVFQKKDGLMSNTIRAMLMDDSGQLWISGNMGLSRLDPPTNTFTHYSKEDGIASNDFYNNATLRSSTGKLFFGSNNGFNAFYPDSIRRNHVNPVVYLSDLKINNESVGIGSPESPLKKHISLTSEIELAYEQRSLMIDFVAINYGQSNRYTYSYKLEGFDQDWNYIGPNHTAIYTNIDPGHYTFLVRASNGDNVWNGTPTRLEITVLPLIWKTWWAMLLYILFVAGVAYFLVKIRVDRVNMRNQLVLERMAREREHELSESKTQFFTNISHEFRTPLSLILMPLESIIHGDRVPVSLKERISTAYRSADKMMRLVNELMDFNKLENGKLKLNLEYGDLVYFIKDVVSVFDDMAEKRNIRFEVNTEIWSLEGWFDRDKLEKILINVLSNAFKFTLNGGEIRIFINSKNAILGVNKTRCHCLELVVLDNGIGISAEEIPRIFDKFYQAKSAAKISNPGTGIGLSLTKALVELHQGKIKAESTVDSETRFTIVLPIDGMLYQDKYGPELADDLFSTGDELQSGSSNGDVSNGVSVAEEKPEILIVEDQHELRNYLSAEFSHDYKVILARDGQEGLDLALDHCPDLVISDILMPHRSGIELCKQIKSDIKTSHIPIILLTAKASVEDQIAGIEIGADLYITKPFSMRYLLTHARNIIGSRQKLYAHFSQDVYLLPAKITSNEIDQAFLEKAVYYITENLQNTQLGVDAIAELFSLSRIQTYRKIKALTGKTVVEFIRMVRLKHALKLMGTKKYTLSEIAYQSGFSSASYFTRCFKDEYGKAPSEYL